jgi:hypothetical protein
MLRRFFLCTGFILLCAFLAGCAAPSSVVTPTPAFLDQATPSPDVVAESTPAVDISPSVLPEATGTSTAAPAPSATVTPEPLPSLEPTYFYFLTVTPSPTPGADTAGIRIFSPGPLSKVSSPFELKFFYLPSVVGTTRVELYGEDGRLLWREVFRAVDFFDKFGLTIDVPFEIRAAAEVGRLQITSLDELKRVKAIKSVRLMLLADGTSVINPPVYLDENVLLNMPEKKGFAENGEVSIEGKMLVFNEMPVIIELLDPRGLPLATRVIIPGPPDGQYHDFSTTLNYKISRYTPESMLVIRQSDDRIPGAFYLYSQEINLNP